MFRRLFWANLALAVPVLAFSDQIQQWLRSPISCPTTEQPNVEPAEAVGAVLMSLSTIVVAANAQLLRHVDLSPA